MSLEIKNVSMQFHNSEHATLHEISLTIEPGNLSVLLGLPAAEKAPC